MANGGTNWWDEGEHERLRERKSHQFKAISDALGDEVHIHPSDDDPGGTEYLYKERTILVRTENAAAVLAELGLQDPQKQDGVPVPGVTTITVPRESEWADHAKVFEHLDRTFKPGFAMPDSVIHITDTGGGCPAHEPVPTARTQPLPARSDGSPADAGLGVTVIVLDSGRCKQVVRDHDWLDGVSGTTEKPAEVGPVYEGHGTFIAGIVRSMAPKADVEIRSFGYKHGSLLESSLAPKLSDALDDQPDIINMSAGVMTRNHQPPIALQVVCERLADPACTTKLVAAAGNDKSTDDFYPASFEEVVSVGALDGTKKLAGYSNHGPNVRVYAQGSGMVNAYPRGRHYYEEPPHKNGDFADFTNGMAKWSGTSFSTPLVTGLIAARMTTHQESAREAWDSLYAKAKSQKDLDIGPILNPGDAN